MMSAPTVLPRLLARFTPRRPRVGMGARMLTCFYYLFPEQVVDRMAP